MKAIIISAALLSACTQTAKQASATSLRQYLDESAIKCHLPASVFKLSGDKQVTFQPLADAKYDDVDCALAELKRSPFPMDLGFTGNEYIEENKK